MSRGIIEHSNTPLNRLLLSVAFLVALVGLGTLRFVVLEKFPILESLYLTLVTISTLGMKLENGYEFHAGGKIWIMLLIIVLQSRDGRIEFNPNPDTVLQAGDIMGVTGRIGSTARLQKRYL